MPVDSAFDPLHIGHFFVMVSNGGVLDFGYRAVWVEACGAISSVLLRAVLCRPIQSAWPMAHRLSFFAPISSPQFVRILQKVSWETGAVIACLIRIGWYCWGW